VARRDGAVLNSEGARSRALIELAVFNLQGAAVPDATLEVQPQSGPSRRVITGPQGEHCLPDVAPGVITIRARRIGFKPGELSATVEAGATPYRSCSARWRRQRSTPFASSADGA
jgi:hypothetical protein